MGLRCGCGFFPSSPAAAAAACAVQPGRALRRAAAGLGRRPAATRRCRRRGRLPRPRRPPRRDELFHPQCWEGDRAGRPRSASAAGTPAPAPRRPLAFQVLGRPAPVATADPARRPHPRSVPGNRPFRLLGGGGLAAPAMTWARFCDPHVDTLTSPAPAQLTDRAAARRLWAQADRIVTDQAPYVPIDNGGTAGFVSPGPGTTRHPRCTDPCSTRCGSDKRERTRSMPRARVSRRAVGVSPAG